MPNYEDFKRYGELNKPNPAQPPPEGSRSQRPSLLGKLLAALRSDKK